MNKQIGKIIFSYSTDIILIICVVIGCCRDVWWNYGIGERNNTFYLEIVLLHIFMVSYCTVQSNSKLCNPMFSVLMHAQLVHRAILACLA